jgi:hypothetical protein
MLGSLDVQLHYVVAVLITTVATVATVRHLPYAATTGVADVLVQQQRWRQYSTNENQHLVDEHSDWMELLNILINQSESAPLVDGAF